MIKFLKTNSSFLLMIAIFLLMSMSGCGCNDAQYDDAMAQTFNSGTFDEVSTPETDSWNQILPSSPTEIAYIEQLLSDPNSLEFFKNTPGYFDFRGVLSAGGDIDFEGHSRVIGAVYAGGNINMDKSGSIIEDSAYIVKVFENFTSPGSKINLDILPGVTHNGLPLSRPVDLSNVPKRARVMQIQEIPPDTKNGGVPDIDSVITGIRTGN